MLAMVQERTREIGVRRALGARRKDIMAQFVLETLVLAVMGGLSGVGLGALIAKGLSLLPEQEAILRFGPCALAFLAAVAVCLFFGLYPAWRASRLDPIEALRYE
jgi:putative ABC transport system permease protein